MHKETRRLFDYILIFIYSLFFIASIVNENMGKYLLLATIAYTLYLIKRHKGNQALLILLIFISTYWFYICFYYFLDIKYSNYLNFQTLPFTNGTLRIQSLFTILLFTFIKPQNKIIIREKMIIRNNPILYYILLVIMILIVGYASLGNNIFSGEYGNDTSNSSIFEYYFIFALCAQVYANSHMKRKILLFINLLYVVALLLLGLRLVTLQVLFMTFIFYYEKKFKTKWIVIGTIFTFFFMSAMSSIRSGLALNDMKQILGIYNNVLSVNQGDVFLTSTVHYALTEIGEFDWLFRLKSFFAFICNIFLLSKYQNQLGILNLNIAPYRVGGGGFGAVYAYVWLGYTGVIGLSIYLAHFINKIYNKNKKSLYGIFLMFTFFRWYSYSLPIVFKMGFWLYIFYKIIRVFDVSIKRRYKIN